MKVLTLTLPVSPVCSSHGFPSLQLHNKKKGGWVWDGASFSKLWVLNYFRRPLVVPVWVLSLLDSSAIVGLGWREMRWVEGLWLGVGPPGSEGKWVLGRKSECSLWELRRETWESLPAYKDLSLGQGEYDQQKVPVKAVSAVWCTCVLCRIPPPPATPHLRVSTLPIFCRVRDKNFGVQLN